MFAWFKGPPSSSKQESNEFSSIQASSSAGGQGTTVDLDAVEPVPEGMVLRMNSAVCYLPHPDKVSYGGEDAHFISSHGGGAIGVADGVGGWQESGVNPAEYSRTLMAVANQYLEGGLHDLTPDERQLRNASEGPLVDPRGALHAAHMRTKVPGSATACVVQLDQPNRCLVAANLGDSGFVIIRSNQIIMRSKALQHYFDCPLQFGAFPEYVEATDTADMADLYQIKLQDGDIIVAGTDGLWDNAYESEIVDCTKGPDVKQAAEQLAALARRHASDNDFASPYSREALSQGLDLPWWEKLLGMSFKNGRFQLRQLSGGKQDDITVIVSRISLAPKNASS